MTAVDVATDQLLDIPVDAIRTSSDNPRSDVGDIEDLTASIREVGVVQPLVVRPASALADEYVLIAGERRLAASKAAGLESVPCVVRDVDEEAALEQTIVENLHRLDLSPADEASGYAHLARLGRTQQEIAAKVGRSQSHVSKRLGLLLLPESALQELNDGHLTVSQAEVLASMRDDDTRMQKLLGLIGRSNFEAVLRAEAGEYQREKTVEAKRQVLEEAGVTLVVTYSVADVLQGPSMTAVDLDPEAHAAEPCHAACVNHNGQVVLLCTDRARHAPDGSSTLKDPRQIPPPDDADAPRSTSSGAPSSSAARTRSAVGSSAAGGEPPAPRPAPAKSAHELEREATLARARAFNDTTATRRQRMTDYLTSRAKPARGDVAHHVASLLLVDDWTAEQAPALLNLLGVPGDDGTSVDWSSIDDTDAHSALVEWAGKGETNLTRFLLAWGLQLVEDSMERETSSQWRGVDAGEFDGNPLVALHYDWLADIGYRPTEAERVLLEGPEFDEDAAADHSPGMTDDGQDSHEGDGDDDLEAEGDASRDAGDGADSHDVGRPGSEPDPATRGEPAADAEVVAEAAGSPITDLPAGEEGTPAADVAPTSDAAGALPLDPTDRIEQAWQEFDSTVRAAKAAGGKQPLHVARDVERLRRAYADAVAAPHSDPGRAATSVSEVFRAYRTELDTNGPIDTIKRGPDDVYRFQPLKEQLLAVVEEGDALLPADLRAEVLNVDGFSFNTREGCPAGHLFPRLRVEDLIDAYSRRVEG